MTEVAPPRPGDSGDGETGVERVFLIADVRGYTRFTRERGDAEAARLASRFAELARDAVEARSGRVIELRGDEALAVFESASQSVRAAVELAAVCSDEAASEGGLPLLVGIGIDIGEAVPVEGGFRGAALNTAARLCSQAAGGQVLVTTGLAERAGAVRGVTFAPAGTAELKGFETPVDLVEAIEEDHPRIAPATVPSPPIPLALVPDLPLVDREHELSWLRGTWRQVQRGYGRVLLVSGPPGIGKTRLAAELVAFAHDCGAAVLYAGAGGTAAAAARSALEDTAAAETPTLLVLDDLDATADAVVTMVEALLPEIDRRSALVLCLVRDAEGSTAVDGLLAAIDGGGDGSRRLDALDADGVRGIAALYAGDDVESAPLESIARASGGVPARVHELISDWAQQEATRRLSAAAEFLAGSRRSRSGDLEFANNVIGLKLGRLYSADHAVALSVGEVPYKGLAAFEEADAALFFGREQLVGELAARTVGAGLLAVVGASGSGKSSVVAAGLIPSLRAGLLPGSERWQATIIRPGEHPTATLPAVEGERLVLVIDQFEEVFTLCADEAERSAFVERLVQIADDPDRAVVVVVLRGDFYGHCGAYPELARLLASNQVLVGPMTGDELRRAIELPARRAGVRTEAPLVDALVAEVEDEPGALPLLSTALVELWQQRDDDWLRLATYERLGGVRSAVARLAETSYENLTGEQREAVRRLFLRLAAIGDEGTLARRRVPLTELDLDRDAVLAAVVERLTADRLLTAQESSIEVAHEALLREWPRFQEWLSEDAQGRELREHLTQSAKRWKAADREPAELYRGARLTATLDWAAGRDQELNELEREFLAESRRHAELEAERQRRQNRRLRGLLIGAAVLLVAAVAGGIVALQQRSSAQHQATVALGRQLGAEAVSEPRIDRAMLLAREAVRLERSPQTEGSLLSTLLRTPSATGTFTVPITVRPLQLTLSPDGHTLAVLDNQSEVLLFDVATRRQVGRLENTGLPGTPLVYTPDGRFAVAFATDQSGLVLMDIRKRRLARLLPMDRVFPNEPTSPANPILVSPDGRSALLTYALVDRERHTEGQVYADRWDLRTGKLVASGPVAGASGMYAAELVDGGRKIVALTNGAAVTFDSRTFRRLKSVPYKLPRGESPGLVSSMSPDGREAATPTSQGVDFVDLRTGAVTESVPVGSGVIENAAFAPDGRTFVTVGDDRRVLVWEAGKPEPVETLLGHGGRVTGLTFAADGHTVFTSSLDGALFEWDLSGSRRFGRPFSIGPLNVGAVGSIGVPALGISPDSRSMAVSPAPGRIEIMSLATSHRLESFDVTHDPQAVMKTIAWPDKSQLLVAWATPAPKLFGLGHSHTELWSIAGRPHRVRVFASPKGTLSAADQSPDGRLAAAITSDQVSPSGASASNLVVWDTTSGKVLASVHRKLGARDVAFSRDGTLVASTWEDGLLLLDARTGRRLRWIRQQSGLGVAAFAPDGTLATGSESGIVQLWDPHSGRELTKQSQVAPAPVAAISFDPRGDTFVASGGSDGVPKLWTTRTLQQLGSDLPGDPGAWLAAKYTPDGSKIVVVSPSNHAWVWPATLGAWQQHACAVAGRNLTKEEWRRFVGGRSYSKICG